MQWHGHEAPPQSQQWDADKLRAGFWRGAGERDFIDAVEAKLEEREEEISQLRYCSKSPDRLAKVLEGVMREAGMPLFSKEAKDQ
eukprot:6177139-Lingulodinium_polyedra.AAC.1